MSASDALVTTSERSETAASTPMTPLPAASAVTVEESADKTQVKYTKDDETVDVRGEQKLIGLTKEQLERYRNDPVWKPIRYTLFALFWLVWIGMFAGAIAIVIASPRCVAKKAKPWHHSAVAYQIFTPTFRDADGDGVGDFNGIKEKLNDLRRVGVTAIWPSPLLTTNKNDFGVAEIVDGESVDPRFGTESELMALIERAHDLNLYFIADLPLTVSSDSSLASHAIGTNKIRLLNLGSPTARESVKRIAARLIGYGVDGLHLAQYGLRYTTPGADYAQLDALATEIRADYAAQLKDATENFVVIVDTPPMQPNLGVNYYTRSLARPISATAQPPAGASPRPSAASMPPTPSAPACRGASFVACALNGTRPGLEQIALNATALPMWQLGDLVDGRADSLFGAPNERALEASALATAIQLFLPGPVSVLYGEELGIPSIAGALQPQFGLLPWSDAAQNAGFSSLDGTIFFRAPADLERFAFNRQYDDTHSNLKVFKKLAQLHVSDEVFQDGAVNSTLVNGVWQITRTLDGDEKAYVLVANWPTDGDRTAKQYAVDASIIGDKRVLNAELVVDHPLNAENPWQLILDSSKLTLQPYEFALIRLEVA